MCVCNKVIYVLLPVIVICVSRYWQDSECLLLHSILAAVVVCFYNKTGSLFHVQWCQWLLVIEQKPFVNC